jgi:hypothetical protein
VANPALEDAIVRTIIYADTFNFPMTLREIHHFLIGVGTTAEAVGSALRFSDRIREHVQKDGDYYMLRGREALVAERLSREAASRALLPAAFQFGRVLGGLPFVRMVALTGALAMHNAHHSHDDIDYLIVTKAGRVWLSRALIVVVVRLAALRGVGLCPNYVLAETALTQQTEDLYIAHEMAQMIPITGLRVYEDLRAANFWTTGFLPNATALFYQAEAGAPHPVRSRVAAAVKRVGEWLFGGRLGDALETWEKRRKLRKFAPRIVNPLSSALLDDAHVKGHFNDYGRPTLRRYEARLVEYQLSKVTEAPVPGPLDERTERTTSF